MNFDPYYKWLGIPPDEQPPNHYRLLGLRLFESDPDVIDAATEQRASYLQHCATGAHVEESQKILNEVAAARICLLNGEKKQAYDATLRASPKLSKQISAVILGTDPAAPGGVSSLDDASTVAPIGPVAVPRRASRALANAGPAQFRQPAGPKWTVADAYRRFIEAPTWLRIGGTVAMALVLSIGLWLLLPASGSGSADRLSVLPEYSTQLPVNSPPATEPEDRLIVEAIDDQSVEVGELLAFTINAKSLHNNRLTLRFTLDTSAPAFAGIDWDSGRFWWVPKEEHAGKSFPIAIRVAAFNAENNRELAEESVRFTVAVKSAPPSFASTAPSSIPNVAVTTSKAPSKANNSIGSTPQSNPPPAPPKSPRITLQPLSAVSMKSGDTQRINVRAVRENSDAEIRLQFQGLPSIVKAGATTIPRGANQVEVELSSEPTGKDVRAEVRVVASIESVSHTQTFSLVVAKRPPKDVVFDDDFKDPAKSKFKLPTFADGNRSARYEKGLYKLQFRPGQIGSLTAIIGPALTDFEFNARMRISGTSPSGTGAFVLTFRDQASPTPDSTRLAWFITANGATTFIRQVVPASGAPIKTADEYLPMTPVESFKASWNRIRLKAVGSKVELEINGLKRQFDVGGPNYKPNTMDVWFALSKYEEQDSCSLEIDDVRVERINPQ